MGALDRCQVAMDFYQDSLDLSVIGPGEWSFRGHKELATGYQDDFYPS